MIIVKYNTKVGFTSTFTSMESFINNIKNMSVSDITRCVFIKTTSDPVDQKGKSKWVEFTWREAIDMIESFNSENTNEDYE